MVPPLFSCSVKPPVISVEGATVPQCPVYMGIVDQGVGSTDY